MNRDVAFAEKMRVLNADRFVCELVFNYRYRELERERRWRKKRNRAVHAVLISGGHVAWLVPLLAGSPIPLWPALMFTMSVYTLVVIATWAVDIGEMESEYGWSPPYAAHDVSEDEWAAVIREKGGGGQLSCIVLLSSIGSVQRFIEEYTTTSGYRHECLPVARILASDGLERELDEVLQVANAAVR